MQISERDIRSRIDIIKEQDPGLLFADGSYEIEASEGRPDGMTTFDIGPRDPSEKYDRIGTVSMLLIARYDEQGNYLGGQTTDGSSFNDRPISLWVNEGDLDLLVRYAYNKNDFSTAIVSEMIIRKGKDHERGSHLLTIPQDEWQNELDIRSLPMTVAVPETINRLVMGVDLEKGTPIGRNDLEIRPLIPA